MSGLHLLLVTAPPPQNDPKRNGNGFFYAYLRGLLKRNLFHLSGAKSN